MAERSGPDTFLKGVKILIRKSWRSKYYTQTETRRDPENNRFDVNWLRKIVNISNNATLDGLYGF